MTGRDDCNGKRMKWRFEIMKFNMAAAEAFEFVNNIAPLTLKRHRF